jgi:uncharacterized protein (DUF362 family)/NAD-dependent dihydropyrimidine dehydrogenase PreA subunit
MSKVVLKECTTYDINNVIEKVNNGIELIGGWNKFVRPGMKVLLKVNLIGPKTSDSAAVTHCEFVRAITRILRNRGCIVWIGDSSGGAIAGIAPTAQGFIVSGLEKAASEEGAEIKNFDREGVVQVSRYSDPSAKMYIAKPMFDADLVINLPKYKTHTAGIYTGAVKNVFGCIPGLKKAEYHKNAPNPLEFGEVISDINKAVKIGLHIMDGITAMQGEGPTAGEVYNAGKILISTDPLALDTVAAKMIGIDIDNIPILQASIKRNLGEHQLNNITLLGDYDEMPTLSGFKLPKNFGIEKKKDNSKALSSVIKLLKSRPKINLKKCKKCNMCVDSCPVKAINKENKKIDYSKCIECLCCHELCLHKAVELKRDNPLVGFMLKFYKGAYK